MVEYFGYSWYFEVLESNHGGLLLAFLTSFISCYRKDSCTTFFQIGVLLSLGKGDESLQRCHGCNSSLRAKKTFGIFSLCYFCHQDQLDQLWFIFLRFKPMFAFCSAFQVAFVGLWSCGYKDTCHHMNHFCYRVVYSLIRASFLFTALWRRAVCTSFKLYNSVQR